MAELIDFRPQHSWPDFKTANKKRGNQYQNRGKEGKEKKGIEQ
jgi:hypothetical protein